MNKDEKTFLSDVISSLVLLVVIVVLSILSAYFVPKEKKSHAIPAKKSSRSNTNSQAQIK